MDQTVKLALIGTYPEVSELFLSITKEMNRFEAVSIHASFENAVEKAVLLEPELDAVLSRGGTANYIRNSVELPVIFIPITPFDIIKAIHRLPPSTERAAVVHYRENVLNLQEISDLYGMELKEYLFDDYADIEESLKDARACGFDTVIGGEVAAGIARGFGMTASVVSAGYVAVSHAIEEAVHLVMEKRKEQAISARHTAAFSSLSEGLVVLDEENRITVFNSAATAIFGRKLETGDLLSPDIIPGDAKDGIIKIRGKTYTASYSPVKQGQKTVGMVCRFEDVTRVEAMEQKIRKETYAKGFVAKYSFSDIIGKSSAMERTKEVAGMYADTEASLLIEGESGTGKELLAQSIHHASSRRNGPFVAVNCTAIPENLLESELFGYASGAFTGAKKEGKPGYFEMAHRGTIFLDEIGEMPGQLQARLLRVLQEREVMRVGGNKVIPVDVRVISATNRNLWSLTQEGSFRSDLYFRLNVFHISVPPLREREGDIELLAEAFAGRRNIILDRSFYETVVPVLKSHNWPGNVREFESVMERYFLLKNVYELELMEAQQLVATLGLNEGGYSTDKMPMPARGTLKQMMDEVERSLIERTLSECGNNHQMAADILGIGKTTLWRKLKETI